MRLGAVLYVYKGEFGLPTIDFECMRALCLVKFTRFPAEINTDGNPLLSGHGKLPYLQVGNQKFIGYRQIKEFLDNECFPIDKHLSGKTSSLSGSFTTWVFNQMHGYYNYYMHCEPKNYEVTRSLYAARTRFPLNFYYPATYAREAEDIVLAMHGINVLEKVEKVETDYIVQKAINCINKLSKRLGKFVWFFGNNYSEFDAIVYSYLSLLLHVELPNNPIAIHIKGHKNLTNFISRISRDMFRDEAFSTKKALQKNPRLSNTEKTYLEADKKMQLLAGVSAILAMSAFAVWRKLKKQVFMARAQYGYEVDDEDEELDL